MSNLMGLPNTLKFVDSLWVFTLIVLSSKTTYSRILLGGGLLLLLNLLLCYLQCCEHLFVKRIFVKFRDVGDHTAGHFGMSAAETDAMQNSAGDGIGRPLGRFTAQREVDAVAILGAEHHKIDGIQGEEKIPENAQ